MSESLTLSLNGNPVVVPAGATVAQLLQRSGFAERRVAVECNGAIVPRSRHNEHQLSDGDRLEIVQAIGGG